jgi:uncharacterized protein YehS (DUF1456 family)
VIYESPQQPSSQIEAVKAMTALVPERQHYFILDSNETLLKILKYSVVRQNNLQVAFILKKNGNEGFN